jgi:PadR family transcriptional regulator AphA
MALRYALLGLLAERPASGYDLARAFEGDFGRYAWQAGHNRIYPELARLTEEGLVEVVEEGARGRRTYGLTEEGLAELRAWLLEPRGGKAVRNEHVLRYFLLSALERDDARAYLRGIAEDCERQAARLREVVEHIPPVGQGERLPLGWLAAEFGLGQYEASRAWAEWAIGELDRTEPPVERED